MTDVIKIDGLSEFVRSLKKLDSDLPKTLRVAFNDAANIVVKDAQPRIPRRSGRAAASLKARSTQTSVRVRAGGPRASYYPFLDFGGRVGRNKSVHRPFLKEGRYLYRSYFDNRPKVAEAAESALLDAVRRAGIEVD